MLRRVNRCIIQDDRDDRVTEIAKMKTIYQHARVTIAASRAGSVHDGFLTKADRLSKARPEPTIVSVGERNLCLVIDAPEVRPYPESAAKQNPLDDRAWALQEHVMSDHLLLYECYRVELSCKHMFTADDDTPRNRGWTRLTSSSWTTSPRELWLLLVEDYSQRKMKFASDKLVAISAIAQSMAEELGEEYLAGLWLQDLLVDLQWAVNDTSRLSSVHSDSTQPETYRAPSWSWASCNHAVSFVRDDTSIRIARVIHYSLKLLDVKFPFGAVTDGYLCLACVSHTANLRSKQPSISDCSPYELDNQDDGPAPGRLEISEDSLPMPAPEEGIPVALLALTAKYRFDLSPDAESVDLVSGLIVQAVHNGKWRRIGTFVACPITWFNPHVAHEFYII